MSEEKRYEEARKSLLYTPKNGYGKLDAAERPAMEAYAGRYMHFLDAAKTEHEAVTEIIRLAEAQGFAPLTADTVLKPGTKVYCSNHGKAVYLAVIGHKPLSCGTRITAAHIDSPRLDLKPNPLYQEDEMAFFKTHYYGGIKKYQWPTIPLSLHGTVVKQSGETVEICIGEKAEDPIFIITDLLPHLAAKQMTKNLSEGITGESLNVLIGSEPLPEDEGSDSVKLAVLMYLNSVYGITEEDFLSAEISLVPAEKARFVGFDRSMIAAYGHDDRSCAYAALDAMLALDTPAYTSVACLVDKEEIGSMGITGMQSMAFEHFMNRLCRLQQVQLDDCFAASECLSADVANAFDPNYGEVSDRRNNAHLNQGVCFMKYTGARGKSGSSDAPAEFVAKIRRMCNENGICWQMGELGAVDAGGGGTVALFMADRNILTLDTGVPVLSMHAPIEIVSVLDAYMTRKAMKAFYEDL